MKPVGHTFFCADCTEQDEAGPSAPYLPDVMEYYADATGMYGKGVHVLIQTLADMWTRKKPQSQRVYEFVTGFSARLPVKLSSPMYMEGYLHASHFPVIDEVTLHVYGCMPLSLYSSENSKKAGTINVQRYVHEALCDAESTRSYDEACISYYFSVMCLAQAETDGRVPVVRLGLSGGLQHPLSQKEYAEHFGDYVLSEIHYDQSHAKMHVAELCGYIRKYGWPLYFHTQTANMKAFPGLREIYTALQSLQVNVTHFQVLMSRVWERSCKLFYRWIAEDANEPLGPIGHQWIRHEFQSPQSPGNLSHTHALLWGKKVIPPLDKEAYLAETALALTRVTADIREAFAYVEDPDVREDLIAAAEAMQHHPCTSKCLRPDGTCRHGCPHPLNDNPEYTEFALHLPAEMTDLLLQSGIAWRAGRNSTSA